MMNQKSGVRPFARPLSTVNYLKGGCLPPRAHRRVEILVFEPLQNGGGDDRELVQLERSQLAIAFCLFHVCRDRKA